jgi:hypothetical protein
VGVQDAIKAAQAKIAAQDKAAANPSSQSVAPAVADVSGVIDALIELFSASQRTGGQTSEFGESNKSVNNSFFKSLRAQSQRNITSSLQSLRGGESGLYALVLKNKLELEKETELKAIYEASSVWNYLINKLDVSNSVEEQNAKALSLLNFPEYYIFILSRTEGENPIPSVAKDNSSRYSFLNIYSYPTAAITSSKLRKSELESGTLVKIKYENAMTQEKPIIVEVVEEDPQFTTVVMASMIAKSAQNNVAQCEADSSLTGVTHATGDVIGSSET